MKKTSILAAIFACSLSVLKGQPATMLSSTDQIKTDKGTLTIQAIMHASLVLKWNEKIIYIDPTGGAEKYKGIGAPDLILITDIHGDHYDPKTIVAVNTKIKPTNIPVVAGQGNQGARLQANGGLIIAPQAVADLLGKEAVKPTILILKNDQTASEADFSITAIPMYNLPQTAESRHPKGRGNGYVINFGNKKIYISGDTQGIPEMLALKDIEAAFVCMNLPYTMDINEASKAVLSFKPKVVYPFHYRGQDVNAFKQLVNSGNSSIDVRLLNWYPTN